MIKSRPHHGEVNPFAREFLNHGTALRVTCFAGGAGVFLYADHKLNHHHPRMARVLELGTIATEIYWTNYSIRHGKW